MRKVSGRVSMWLALAIAVLAVGGALFGWWKGDSWRRKFGVVKEGVLLRSQLPNEDQLERLSRSHKVKTIVNLLNWEDMKQFPEAKAEQDFAEKHGIRFVHMPTGIPTPDQVAEFLQIVNDSANWPVLVHCVQGTVRTGMMVAVFRMENEGWSNQQALDEMGDYGFDSSKPDQAKAVDFVLAYQTKAKGASPGGAGAAGSSARQEKEQRQ